VIQKSTVLGLTLGQVIQELCSKATAARTTNTTALSVLSPAWRIQFNQTKCSSYSIQWI